MKTLGVFALVFVLGWLVSNVIARVVGSFLLTFALVVFIAAVFLPEVER